MTAEEYYAVSVEGDRKQLVDGAIIVTEPKFIHAALQPQVLYALEEWRRAGQGRGVVTAPTDIAMDEHNVYGART